MNIVESLIRLVKKASHSPTNKFSPEAWENHIKLVYEYSQILAGKLGADKEIVVIAALLHDYASLLNADWVGNHHLISADLAADILRKKKYPKEKTLLVVECILSHRGSKNIPRESIEAECVASADALSHIIAFPSILRLALIAHNLPLQKAVPWARAKIEKSYVKLHPEAKKIAQPYYEAILKICEIYP